MRGLDLRRAVDLARPELPLLAVATVALVISSGLGLVYPQVVQWVVDVVVGEGAQQTLNQMVFWLLGLFAVQAVFTMVRSWLFTVAGERVVARLRSDLFRSILRQDIAFFDTERTGELTNRLAADAAVLQNTVTVNVSMALRYGLTSIGAIALLAWMSPTLTLVALAIIPVVIAAAAVFGTLISRLSTRVQDQLAEATTIAEESFGGVRTVRSFAQESVEEARYTRAVDNSFRLAAKRALALGGFSGIVSFAAMGALALVIWWGGSLVLTGAMTVGELTAFLLYTMMVAMSLGALTGLYADFMKSVGASTRVFQLLDQTAELETLEGQEVDNLRGDVHLEGVDFSYPSRPDIQVLRDFSLRLAPGETIALVGPSGAGKSTVAALLSRFYDPESGTIWIDDTDIREFQPQALRRHVGLVAQEPVLFATTILENIRYGRPEASDEEVHAAARAANAAGFIGGFAEGFETEVGERGVRLSGGQKQRVAIARALLKDPRILVLDEATSALDAESEHLVQEALDHLMKGRTTLIIAHRLSTVRDADRVVVLDRGQIVEQGTHDELLHRDGLYRRLVERQFGAAA